MSGSLTRSPAKPIKPGRPKGAKNKTTIFKEVMREGFENKLQKDFHRVLDSVVELAAKGDMKAAKLLMDRVIPVNKAVDMETLQKGGLNITISVGSMEEGMKADEAIDADFEEVKEDGSKTEG